MLVGSSKRRKKRGGWPTHLSLKKKKGEPNALCASNGKGGGKKAPFVLNRFPGGMLPTYEEKRGFGYILDLLAWEKRGEEDGVAVVIRTRGTVGNLRGEEFLVQLSLLIAPLYGEGGGEREKTYLACLDRSGWKGAGLLIQYSGIPRKKKAGGGGGIRALRGALFSCREGVWRTLLTLDLSKRPGGGGGNAFIPSSLHGQSGVLALNARREKKRSPYSLLGVSKKGESSISLTPLLLKSPRNQRTPFLFSWGKEKI